ncbi:glycoside hydrolase family 43 protein [Clostridium manihotivorum]|uniref:Glycoside hydrolase 43 family protein n=1 Tax=Clostridium manihotivorum TaxID=2320868 RepID=A0A3R5QUK2_9CLOT|nr:glycoside hydrolase family 43 protein [Clostridium manihotivorum]QAA32978.1 glycoside hydrolase 43 family protein [Clostridium manihotivorum]
MNKINNPIFKGFNPDPSICRCGEDYYIATSTFEWFPGVQIHHSKDLKNWNLIKRPLDRVSQLNMSGDPDSGGIWAPCLTYSDNKFWLIYTDVKQLSGIWKDSLNYLVTSDSITGQWSEPIFLNSSGFDPSLFHDDDGKKYLLNMVWDHREGNHQFYGIVLQEYSVEEKKLIGNPKLIFKGTEIRLTEGPHIYKINGYYYLMVAEGGTKYEHAVTIARSKNITGPYELHPENPILTSWNSPTNPLQKAGHASLVHTHSDEWYLAHLVGRPLTERGCCPLGRETAIEKIEWHDGWPYVANGREPSLYVEAPKIEEVKWEPNYPVRDDFDEEELNINFQTLRVPLDQSIMTLKERKGYLRLRGKQSLTSKFLQAHVARRWQSFNFDAITGLQFNPSSFQQMAGLVCYYNTENWVYINITMDEELGKVINLIECDNFKFSEPLKNNKILVPQDVETVHFKVEVRREKYNFLYSFDEKQWVDIPIYFDSNKLSDDYIRGEGFFTGAFVGMYCQDATGQNLEADFDYFTYKEIY